MALQVTVTDNVNQIAIADQPLVISEQIVGIQGAAGQSGSNGAQLLLSNQSFSSVSAVTLDNVFNSNYKDYLIRFNFTSFSGTSQISMNFRRSGATLTGANYSNAVATLGTTYSGSSASAATSITLTANGVVPAYTYEIAVHAPFISSTNTGFKSYSFTEYISNVQTLISGRYKVAQIIDGLYLYFGGNTGSGSVQIYGWVN